MTKLTQAINWNRIEDDKDLEIWNRVYEELVEPCIRMIHANQHEQAHQHYKSYASNLAQIYLIPEG